MQQNRQDLLEVGKGGHRMNIDDGLNTSDEGPYRKREHSAQISVFHIVDCFPPNGTYATC